MAVEDGRDTLFEDARGPHPFRFDAGVAAVFEDMIRRSVPGYETLVELIGVIGAEYAQAGTRVYDLGCALGAASMAIARHLRTPGVRLFAVDRSADMADRCRGRLHGMGGFERTEVVCADIAGLRVENASVVVLNLTLQFVEPALREPLLARIRSGLRPGGVLVLSEKTAAADGAGAQRWTALHEAYKRAQGYSALEIARKRAALEAVLIPEAEAVHESRLQRAGFGEVRQWFRCLHFVSWLAFP